MLKFNKAHKKREINKQIYKYILMQIARNPVLFFSIHKYIIYLYHLKNFRIMGISNKNICFLTGRSRAVYRAFHLSRLKIREYGQQGYFIGLKKIS